MATFPDSPSERGGARFGGAGLGQPGIVQPDPRKPKVASLFTPQAGGGMTLEALMLKQKELAARRGVGEGQPIQSWTQGLAQALDQTLSGFQQGRVERDINTGNKAIADVFASADPATGEYSADAAAKVAQWNPEFAAKILADRRAALHAEHWEDMPAPPGAKEGQLYQRNSVTGEVRTAGGSGASVTINPPTAETGAKLGLAQGFLDNYADIITSAQAGEMTGGGYISGVQLGRGNGGKSYRNLLQGTEALVRMMTGAGMSEGEARQRVVQYEPSLTDDADTLVSKIQGLKQAIDNVMEGVQTRGAGEGGGEGDTKTPERNPYVVGETYDFTTPDGKPIRGKYKGGDIGAASSWEAVQ